MFDRRTGEPVWPIPDLPVNDRTTVPGEKLWPTQPHPTKPPPFESQGFGEDDLIDFTPELRVQAKAIMDHYVVGSLFTPSIVKGTDGKRATIVNPGAGGGANWPGAAIDPETGVLYVQSQTDPSGMSLIVPDGARTDFNFMMAFTPIDDIDGLPIYKPPWRRITAIDLNRGEHLWQIPFGEGPTDHPLLAGVDTGPLGTRFPRGVISEGGLLLTRTLLVAAMPKVDELGDRSASGSWLQAYDKATGRLLAEVESDRWFHGSPMTYLHAGRQYIVVAGGGQEEPAELVAFALPVG